MPNNSISPIFTEITLSEQASLSGGKCVAIGGRGGNGADGADGKSGRSISKNGRNGKVYKSGKLSKADRKVLRQTLADLSDLFSDLF